MSTEKTKPLAEQVRGMLPWTSGSDEGTTLVATLRNNMQVRVTGIDALDDILGQDNTGAPLIWNAEGGADNPELAIVRLDVIPQWDANLFYPAPDVEPNPTPTFLERMRLQLKTTGKPISVRLVGGRVAEVTRYEWGGLAGNSMGENIRWGAAGRHMPTQGQRQPGLDISTVVTDTPVKDWAAPSSPARIAQPTDVPEWAPTLEPAGVPWVTNGEIVGQKFTPMTHNLKGDPVAEAVVKAQQPVKTSMGFSIEEMFEAAKASQPIPVAPAPMGLKQCTLEELNAGDVVVLENGIEANITEHRTRNSIVHFFGTIDPVPGSSTEPLSVVWDEQGGWLSTTELGDIKFTAAIKTCFKRVQLAPPMPTGGAECDVDWLSIIDGYPDVAYHDVVATLRNGHKIKVKVNPDEPVNQFPIERAEGYENKSWTRYGRVYQGEASAYDITDINLVQRTVEEPTFNRAQKIEAVARRLAQVDGYEPEALTILGTPMQAIPGVVLVTGRAGLVPVWERYVERATSLVDLIVQSEMQKL